MSDSRDQVEIDSPIFPQAFIHRTKHQILNLRKLQDPPISNFYKSTNDDTSTTFNLDMIVQSPLRKRKIIRPKGSLSKNKNKDNKSQIHANNTISSDLKTDKKIRPQSSTLATQLNKRKSINLNENVLPKTPSKMLYIRPFMPPLGMTAYSYIIMEGEQIHVSWNSKTMVEMASLTKIMTCYCVLNILSKYGLDWSEIIQVGIVETAVIGTSAKLKKNYRYSVHQLLYGLMLPSGNDASLALAVWGGRTLANKSWKSNAEVTKKRQAIALFVEYMNSMSKQLDLKKTKFSNPHGLSSPDNKSTAYDLSILCQKAMKNAQFKKIVATKEYQTTVITDKGDREHTGWKNTHKLLKKDCYLGIKTGVTSTAGACLSSFVNINQRDFVIIVLNCKKLQRRFKQTEILRKWLYKKQNLCRAEKSLDIDFQIQLQDIENDKDLFNQ